MRDIILPHPTVTSNMARSSFGAARDAASRPRVILATCGRTAVTRSSPDSEYRLVREAQSGGESCGHESHISGALSEHRRQAKPDEYRPQRGSRRVARLPCASSAPQLVRCWSRQSGRLDLRRQRRVVRDHYFILQNRGLGSFFVGLGLHFLARGMPLKS